MVDAGATVLYTWTVAATSPTGIADVNLQVTGLRNPRLSYSGAGNFTCQPGVGVSDFFQQCDGNSGLGPGQTATFTVTGQAPFSGGTTITADGSMSIGTQTVVNINTGAAPVGFRKAG